MNEDLVIKIVKAIQAETFSLGVISYLLIAVVSMLSGLFGMFFASYIKEKGKNYATKEDFNNLLEQTKATTKETEAIKLEISRNGWREAKQWELKFKIYTEILESLAEWRTTIEYILRKLFDGEGDLRNEDNSEKIEKFSSRLNEVFLKMSKIESISEIVLTVNQSQRIRNLRGEVTKGLENIPGKKAFVDAVSSIVNLEKEISQEAKLQLFSKDG